MVHSFASRPRHAFAAVAAVLLMAGSTAFPAPIAGARVEFNRDIRPILSDNCFSCHGPDASHREADLRLDVREDAISAGAIVPGKVAESTLVGRILAADPDEIMPPPESHKKLDERQKSLLARWIESGAEYQPHWAYVPPEKPSVPSGAHPIDHLLRSHLTAAGLDLSPEADRRTLIRRLSFDLIGLPPTPEEVDRFVNDQSPEAYDTLVERLLASPHYGERMAIGWLDVVRFADTIGYHSDNPRNVWPYRDYVIRCFNDNKPFDRFTIEQLAGDLLPDASLETLVASCFNRLLLTTEEGGAQPKDYESRMLTDRVRAVGAVWLGQTTGCAQCHDHKFDPITMRDFYSLGAFFADLNEPSIGKRGEGKTVGTPEDMARLAELDAAVADANKKLAAVVPLLDAAQQQWEADVVGYGVTLPEFADAATAGKVAKQQATQVAAVLAKEEGKRNGKDKSLLQGYFRSHVTKRYREEIDAAASAKKARDDFHASLAKCLVSEVTAKPRIVRILPRGNWMDESGEVVKPALPGYLPKSEAIAEAAAARELTRLDLAEWLVSEENPLTARVVMNRLWKQFFGAGLSRVLDDLGAQGEPPTHPELLDWLACEFRDSGWDMKHMVRSIVSSAAYRQSSRTTPGMLGADPFNRSFARQSAFRIDAELVRDTVLATSGLLVRSIGGPSVKPYQPEGYWENLNFPKRTYVADVGEKTYRRGLYTWWQRSFLHPSMLAFDAPSREECCAERTRSNIPQQALVLLNDPNYVEASRAFAVRIVQDGGDSDDSRMAWAWRQALQRPPRIEEMETVMPLLKRHVVAYAADQAAAKALLAVGSTPMSEDLDPAKVAAWTHIARVLFNLHETITRN